TRHGGREALAPAIQRAGSRDPGAALVGAVGAQHPLGHERIRIRCMGAGGLPRIAAAARRRRHDRSDHVFLDPPVAAQGAQRRRRQFLLLVFHCRHLDSPVPDPVPGTPDLLSMRDGTGVLAHGGVESDLEAAAEYFSRWPGILRLSLGLLLGPIVVLTSQELIYLSGVWVCGLHMSAVLHVVPVLCLVVCIGAGVASYNDWRRVGGGAEEE